MRAARYTHPMLDASDQGILTRLDALRPLLESVSREIHEHPELAFEERRASALLARILDENGFSVTQPAGGLETAFVATAPGSDSGGPAIGILAEYDALPGLGHACAHNLIAAVALGAALAAAPLLGETAGSIKVFGTPAEEGGVGKAIMLDSGAFEGIDAVLAFHATNGVTRISSASWAAIVMQVRFKGKAAHAAAAPWDGINALDAMIGLFSSIGLMRQQLIENARVHGIITNGGEAFNVIPELTEAEIAVRSYDTDYVQSLADRVRRLAEAAAAATGCSVEVEQGRAIEGIRYVSALGAVVEGQCDGLDVAHGEAGPFVASTDFGNVSQSIPSVQFELGCFPRNSPLHSRELADVSAGDAAHDAMMVAARVLALSAAHLLKNPKIAIDAKREWENASPGAGPQS